MTGPVRHFTVGIYPSIIIIPPSPFHEMQSAWIRQTLVFGGGSGASCLTWLIRGGTWAIDPAVQGLSCPAIVISPCLSLSLSPPSHFPSRLSNLPTEPNDTSHAIQSILLGGTGQILPGSCWVPAGLLLDSCWNCCICCVAFPCRPPAPSGTCSTQQRNGLMDR